MPYFIFKYLKQDENIDSLEYITQFDNFKQAKDDIRKLRSALPEGDNHIIKMVFADNQEQASSKLQEKRTAPILREWEK